MSKIVKQGEFVELEVTSDLKASPVYNDDLAPTKIAERSWSKWHIMSLWVGMAICVPTYTLGAVLTSYFGLTVMESLWTILAANVIVLIPLILNAFPGTKFGVPFPILLRSSFGIYGSNLPALIRALIACGWFGIQTMFGGLAIHLILARFFPAWATLGGVGEVLGFAIFWVMNIYVVVQGSTAIKILETLAAPLLIVVGVGLLLWAFPLIDMTALLNAPPKREVGAGAWSYIFAGLTAMVGFWATLSLNIPDFSRYAKSQKDQIWGQILGLPLTMFLFAMLGVVLTAASSSLFGETISDPVTLIGRIDSPILGAFALFIIIVATISTNAAANILSPSNDFQNAFPKVINFKRGVYLTGVIGIILMSWELLRKAGVIQSDVSLESIYSNWLLSYSCLLGPIAGIMIVDYFLIRKQNIHLIDIYRVGGVYPKINWAGICSFLIPVAITTITLISGVAQWVYNYGWFVGSAMGGIFYYLLSTKIFSISSLEDSHGIK
ncbi:MAG: NCS1 family nucleobase:cation symporter-1 [Bacteriovoracaceae bacterium]|nr:NCS1 family nucleobase:cation symporter-1 [Bacteriovoracaceae bacterium]